MNTLTKTPPVWDIFCQVIDNWGDAGVCWRLASDLATRGIAVRLWIDDPAPLAWMRSTESSLPDAHPLVQIVPWKTPLPEAGILSAMLASKLPCPQVFIEAFGCHAPEVYLAYIAAMATPPVWLNLEYLSAQTYAQDCHGLPSPQQTGPAKGLIRWFYYPGFTPQTGGLLREPALLDACSQFDPCAWLARMDIPIMPRALRASLFCYANAALAPLVRQWQHPPHDNREPIHLLATPGITTRELAPLLGLATAPTPGTTTRHANLCVTWLPHLSQCDFDRLLASTHINFVRGEDSWIRAIWAGVPFIWQPYIQDDGAHFEKLEAFLSLAQATPQWNTFERQWTRQKSPDWQTLTSTLPQTAQRLMQLRARLTAQTDLVTRLIAFAHEKRSIPR